MLCNAEETISNTSTTIDFSYGFDYDMRSQLKQVDIDKNGSPYRNGVYNYRKDGNLDSRTINSSTTSFTYAGDLMDTASGGESFDLDFDDNGNMTTGVSQTITYNWDNKLRTATKGTKSISLRYDPGGNRIWKQSIDGAEEKTRKYIVDIVGDLPTTLMEIDPNIGLIVKTYIYANGQPLCQHDGDYSAPRYFYIHDRLGSTRQIINTSGYVVRYYMYEPFGEVLEEDGTLANYMMFTGQYFDTEIDQYYLRARQYDPHISRFTARDPILGKFEKPMTLHRYLYCLNDPINTIDLDGKWAFSIGLSGSGCFTLSDIGGSNLFRNALPKALGGIADMIQYYSVMMPLAVAISDHVGYGGTVGGAFVVAKDISKGYVTGGGWSYGLMGYVAGGNSLNTGASAAVTIDFGFSWQAQHVTELGGFFVEFGGSFTTPAPFLFFGINTAGFTVSRGQDPESGQFTGIDLWTLSLGWGTSSEGISAEGHGYAGYTWVKEL